MAVQCFSWTDTLPGFGFQRGVLRREEVYENHHRTRVRCQNHQHQKAFSQGWVYFNLVFMVPPPCFLCPLMCWALGSNKNSWMFKKSFSTILIIISLVWFFFPWCFFFCIKCFMDWLHRSRRLRQSISRKNVQKLKSNIMQSLHFCI